MAKTDLLDVLLDPDNHDPITLVDEDGTVMRFEQIAIVPIDKTDAAELDPERELTKDLFCILKPIDKISGVADDEAIVFRVLIDDDMNAVVRIEDDHDLAAKVFDKYLEMLEMAGGSDV